MSNLTSKAPSHSLPEDLISNSIDKTFAPLPSLDKFQFQQTIYELHKDQYKSASIILTHENLTIEASKIRVIPLTDILGAALKENSLKKDDQFCCLKIYLLKRRPVKDLFHPHSKQFKRVFEKMKYWMASRELAIQWKNVILQAANNPNFFGLLRANGVENLPIYKRRLLVFVSPYSGKKKGIKIWRKAKKFLVRGGCEFIEIYTEYSSHTKDSINQYDTAKLKEIDGIITVSGDGGFHEIVNGLYKRDDIEEVKNIPIGVIPSGTSNSLIKNLLEKADEVVSTETVCNLIAKGRILKSDLTELKRDDGTKIYCSIMMVWAAFADVDVRSHKLRMLGKLRFPVCGCCSTVNMRRYRARIICKTDSNDMLRSLGTGRQSWEILPESFAHFSIHNLAWISSKCQTVPFADFQDGYNHLLALTGEEVSKIKLVKTLAELEGGVFKKHGKQDPKLGIIYRSIKAFRIELEGDNKQGFFNIDGEPYKASNIDGRVLENTLCLFGPPSGN